MRNRGSTPHCQRSPTAAKTDARRLCPWFALGTNDEIGARQRLGRKAWRRQKRGGCYPGSRARPGNGGEVRCVVARQEERVGDEPRHLRAAHRLAHDRVGPAAGRSRERTHGYAAARTYQFRLQWAEGLPPSAVQPSIQSAARSATNARSRISAVSAEVGCCPVLTHPQQRIPCGWNAISALSPSFSSPPSNT